MKIESFEEIYKRHGSCLQPHDLFAAASPEERLSILYEYMSGWDEELRKKNADVSWVRMQISGWCSAIRTKI